MITRIVKITVDTKDIDAFSQATREHAVSSEKEPGVVRFEVLQRSDEKGVFYFIISFIDDKSRDAHFRTAHYEIWKERVSPLFSAEVEGVTCLSILD